MMWCGTLGCIVTMTLSLLVVPLTAEAQLIAPMHRVGFLHPGSLTPERARYLDSLRQGLRDRGYVEGQSLTLVYRWAEGRDERLPELAAEFVRPPVDVLVAVSLSAVHDLETDPVARGLVTSFARPGGNLTGMFFDFADFADTVTRISQPGMPIPSRRGNRHVYARALRFHHKPRP